MAQPPYFMPLLHADPVSAQSGPRFVGLDLAWSPRNNTAAAVIEANDANPEQGKLVGWQAQLSSNNDIIAFITDMAGTDASQSVFVAIDAPLVVPNNTGLRVCDSLINRTFRRFQAGVHPANRTNLGRYGVPIGDIRGETLATQLEQIADICQSYDLAPREPGRAMFECYPHSAMVALFGLDKTLKYKRRLRSINNDRMAEYRRLQSYLRDLIQFTPALDAPKSLLNLDVTTLGGGRTLKAYEDLLDAIMCAYIAYHYWWWGAERNYVFGTLRDGYIVTPITPELRVVTERLQAGV